LHHVVLESWSRQNSALHARDPRVKIVLLAAYLAALGTAARMPALTTLCYAAPLAAAAGMARLPARALLLRTAVVLPFSATFAAFSMMAGDAGRGEALLAKSYLSAAAVLVVTATTPLPKLLWGFEALGFPRFLILVVQFLYRYLFVISGQAQHMRLAARCRGSASGRLGFRRAAGAIAVLFARSYARAEGIHDAMLARGAAGQIRLLAGARAGGRDFAFLAFGIAVIAAVRIWSL
jgi:cobalt/nickel transport system permease protein